MEIRTGVVAQKYTHKASRYFRPRKYFSSNSRSSESITKANGILELTFKCKYKMLHNFSCPNNRLCKCTFIYLTKSVTIKTQKDAAVSCTYKDDKKFPVTAKKGRD
jgi:hypothetical protein